MSWPKQLVLVRHGESEGNLLSVDERARLDIPTHAYSLTPRGREQAKITGEYLRKAYGTFDAYYVSYYQRSRETMAIMYPDAHIYEDPRLAEAQRGIWHTMTHNQIREKFPEEFERRDREGYYHYRPLGGENWADIELRIHSFLGTLARDYAGEKVLVVGHGHWMILFDRLVRRMGIAEAVEHYCNAPYKNASVTEYAGGDRLIRVIYNLAPWEDLVS